MKDIILSTGNTNKVKEIKSILKGLDYKIVDKNEAGFKDLEIEETGDTLAENAIIKAKAMWRDIGKIVIADDTGLFVDALDGKPGVYSARYAGDNSTDKENRIKLLEEMKDKTDRKARFITSIALIDEYGNEHVLEGRCEGRIAYNETGDRGFGYDSIFIPEGYDKSFGEIPEEIKNEISHRARALEELKGFLENKN